MKGIFFIVFFVSLNFCHAQNDSDTTVNFTKAIRVNLSKFKKHQQDALNNKNLEELNFVFDSLISNQIVGTKFDFPSVRKISGGRLRFKKTKKPLIIFTHTDWLVKNKGEVQALNKLAREYKAKVDFIFLYWNNKEGAKKVSKKLNNNFIICYADESYKYDFRITKLMRNTLGFPTTYQMTDKKIVLNVQRGIGTFIPLKTPLKKAKDENYLFLKNKLNPVLEYADSLSNSTKKKKFLFF